MRTSCRELVRITACLLAVSLAAPRRGGAQAEGQTPGYVFPAGWLQSTNAANGVVTLAPSDLRAGNLCVLTILPPQPSNATAEVFHAQVVQQAASYGRVLGPPARDSVASFLVTTLHQATPSGFLWVRIYTTRWNDRAQVLLLSVNSLQIARAYVPVIETMIRAVRLPQAATGPVALNGAPSSPAPPGEPATLPDRPTNSSMAASIAGLYSATTMRYDPLIGGSVIDQYWYFFSPDGQVCRGYSLPKLQPSANGDFHRFDFAARADADPENCGTFTVHGEKVTMRIGRRFAESIIFRAPDRNGKVTIQRAQYSLWLRW